MKMGKNEIMTISYKEDKDPVVAELEVIAARERKSRSQLVMELIEQYVKQHSAGNSNFKMDDFQDPDFVAMPATMSPKEKWNKFIRENTSKEERDALDAQAKFIREVIDAKNWLDNRNK